MQVWQLFTTTSNNKTDEFDTCCFILYGLMRKCFMWYSVIALNVYCVSYSYKDYRSDDDQSLTSQFWLILALRFAFVILFEVQMLELFIFLFYFKLLNIVWDLLFFSPFSMWWWCANLLLPGLYLTVPSEWRMTGSTTNWEDWKKNSSKYFHASDI